MQLANLRTVRVITPGVMLVCLAITSPLYGFDTRFASGRSALAIPFELDTNIIYLRVSVNDSPPLSFILDTGSSYTILSLRNAQSFGMKLQLLGKVEGGSGAEPPDFYLVIDKVSFSLPEVVLSDQRLVAMSLDKVQECIDNPTDGRSDQEDKLHREVMIRRTVHCGFPNLRP